jgi:STE24 endopeptidase
VNAYAAVALAALVGEFALARLADALNLRALAGAPPPEVRAAWDADRVRRARDYTRETTRLGIVTATLDLAVLLGFWFAGGFGALDRAVRALGLGAIPTGLAFIAALGLGRFALALPVRWWATFRIEARYGFNRTTPRVFWSDVAKGLALAAVVGGPLVAAVLWFFAAAGPRAWLWCWVAVTAYMLGVQFVAPTWIMPLFNRFAPLPDGALREAILAYARAVGFPLAGVFVIDGSRRSTKANALFTGFGRHKRIALFDTLVEKLAPAEVVAVVAHEVGHYRRGHIVQATALGIVQAGVLLLVLSFFLERPGLFEAFYVDTPSVHAGLVLFALVLAPIELALSLVLHAWSRRNEREADAFAVRTTGDGASLARALERLSTDALANPSPHPLYVALHYSHPPLAERVRALVAG